VSQRWDCIVVGLGGMGSAACAALARRGLRVLGLEQFQAVHDRGSSHGETRIIRQCYFEHPDYVPLLLVAYRLWSELESSAARQLYFPVGLLISGRSEGEAVSGARRAAALHQLHLEDLTAAETERRYPVFRMPESHSAVFECDAGYLLVEECVRAQWGAARAAGADLRAGEPVEEWRPAGSQVIVRTARGEHIADRLVVTAGAWSGAMLRDLELPLTVSRKVAAWFPAPAIRTAPESGMPAFYFEQGDGAFYGFPCLDGRTIKVAEHTGVEPLPDPSSIERTVSGPELARVRRFLQEVLPEIGTTAARATVCLYTLSPDHHFIIDRHPEHGNIVFAAGFSGHGFKFCPVVGQALADLAIDGRTDLPIGFLGLQRFRRESSAAFSST
jgi:sarcosine oxidase